MAGILEIIDRNEMDDQTVKRLDELEHLILETEKLRRWQSLVAGCTVLLMLAVLICFIFGLVMYFRTYPKQLLMREVVRQNRLILDNPYHFGCNRNCDRKLIECFLAGIRREFLHRRPFLRQEIRSEIRSVNEFASTDLRRIYRNLLYVRLAAETRLYLKEKGYQPSAVQEHLLKQMNVEIAAAGTEYLFGNPDVSGRRAFEFFQNETAALKKTAMFRELALEPPEMIESRMIECLLECLICRLNGEKVFSSAGKEPAP